MYPEALHKRGQGIGNFALAAFFVVGVLLLVSTDRVAPDEVDLPAGIELIVEWHGHEAER